MMVRLQFSDSFHPELPLLLRTNLLIMMFTALIFVIFAAFVCFFFQFFEIRRKQKKTEKGVQTAQARQDFNCQTSLVQGTQNMSMVSEVDILTPGPLAMVPSLASTPNIQQSTPDLTPGALIPSPVFPEQFTFDPIPETLVPLLLSTSATSEQSSDLTPGDGALVPTFFSAPLTPSFVPGGLSPQTLNLSRRSLRRTSYLDVITLPRGVGIQTPVMLRSGVFFCVDCQDCGCDPQCTCGHSHTGKCTCNLECDCPGKLFPNFIALTNHLKIHRTTRKYSFDSDEMESPTRRIRLS
jgi:hypothetical protein